MKKGYEDWRTWHIDDKTWNFLRASAVKLIEIIEKGGFIDETVNRFFFANPISGEQRGLIYEMVSGVIRWKGYLDWVLKWFARAEPEGTVKYLIWVTLYQIAFMKKSAHHVVKEAVEYGKARHGIQVGRFMNAVLRGFLRDVKSGKLPLPYRHGKPDLSSRHLWPPLYSFPRWLVDRWVTRFGPHHCAALLNTLNTPPEFTLRINDSAYPKDRLVRRLEELGLQVRPGVFLKDALRVDKLGPLLHDDLFINKVVSVQDEASQLAVHALQTREKNLVLDACCGRGTKASHIMDLIGNVRLLAMDLNMGRLESVDRRAWLVKADIFQKPLKGNIFDAILLDAPCSSLGIIRKHPEIKWRRNQGDIRKFGEQQYSMLRSAWDVLKVGGHLVYSVCSFEPEETVDVVERFSGVANFVLENPFPFLFNNKYFVSVPHQTGMDGFFIARLRKL